MGSTLQRDYSLLGKEAQQAIDNGLADAEWYTCYVPEEEMKKLLVRKDWPAIRDTVIWFSLIFISAALFIKLWGSWWCIIPLLIYSVLFTAASNSRWHETSHGTAFKTQWMNNALYEIASFMSFYQSVSWRWSHARHHSDTIVRGRDPEIILKRPPNIFEALNKMGSAEIKKIIRHAFNSIDPETATYVPKSEHHKIFFRARIYLLVYGAVVGLSIYLHSPIPVMLLFLPPMLGSWLLLIYALTQHIGLSENVLDHRLNSRTVYMNRINRFLYWNMNYHVEHHMFPMVPYHALPRLHELIKEECPKPCSGIWDAYKEIIPALIKQYKDPEYTIKKELPPRKHVNNNKKSFKASAADMLQDGWVKVCNDSSIKTGDIARLDIDDKTFAIYKTESGNLYATDGMCTHGNAHLSTGLIVDEKIECSKHNGQFNLKDGSPARLPVCINITTYPVKQENGNVFINLSKLQQQKQDEFIYTVVSNNNLTTYIKELELKPDGAIINYTPGDYIQLVVPAASWSIGVADVHAKYHHEYKKHNLFNRTINNTTKVTRNYSLATNPATDQTLKFNVRLGTPPEGSNYPLGIGSSYVFQLKPGDKVKLKGPFGNFHIQDTNSEMVYIGGGAGMAPLKSHISHLLQTLSSKRKISFWYGARTANDLFYIDYFELLAKTYNNFSFHVAVSINTDNWKGLQGHIHEVIENNYISCHENPKAVEYYLCGPPVMIQAAKQMLWKYEVPDNQILFDEF
jgi:Na+-transporting NADH:ubiquinone oxidoreductase subunit F